MDTPIYPDAIKIHRMPVSKYVPHKYVYMQKPKIKQNLKKLKI